MHKEFEIWKPVVGYECRYEVSDKGRVRSLLTGKMMAQRLRKGYYSTGLFKDGKRELGIDNITCVLHGKRKQAGGFKWVFKDNYYKNIS